MSVTLTVKHGNLALKPTFLIEILLLRKEHRFGNFSQTELKVLISNNIFNYASIARRNVEGVEEKKGYIIFMYM